MSSGRLASRGAETGCEMDGQVMLDAQGILYLSLNCSLLRNVPSSSLDRPDHKANSI